MMVFDFVQHLYNFSFQLKRDHNSCDVLFFYQNNQVSQMPQKKIKQKVVSTTFVVYLISLGVFSHKLATIARLASKFTTQTKVGTKLTTCRRLTTKFATIARLATKLLIPLFGYMDFLIPIPLPLNGLRLRLRIWASLHLEIAQSNPNN